MSVLGGECCRTWDVHSSSPKGEAQALFTFYLDPVSEEGWGGLDTGQPLGWGGEWDPLPSSCSGFTGNRSLPLGLMFSSNPETGLGIGSGFGLP